MSYLSEEQVRELANNSESEDDTDSDPDFICTDSGEFYFAYFCTQ